MNDPAKILENLERIADENELIGPPRTPEMIREGIELIKSLFDEVERLTLLWTSEKPEIAGDYLSRWALDRKLVDLVKITEFMLTAKTDWFDGKEFAGPIVVAEPTTESEAHA